MTSRPHVLYLGSGYAGHKTRFQNLRVHTQQDGRLEATYHTVSGWVEGGRIERLPLVPAGLKGRVRGTLQAAPLASFPRPDAIWLGSGEVVSPYLWAQRGPFRRPLIKDLDATLDLLNEQAEYYYGHPPRRGLRLTLGQWLERQLWHSATLFTAWSGWVADALRDKGIADERIIVLPPGVDMDQWRPGPEPRPAGSGALRLLFVGGDFLRKGGPVLLDLIRTRFAGRCTLDVVTRDEVTPTPGVRVHRAEANSAGLRALYAQADVFVLPSQAECFGLATIEALASGVPVIVSDRGGARDIVDPGQTGWLVEPDPDNLGGAIEQALATDRATLAAMGRRARRVAEERFDGRRNDTRVIDLLLDQIARFRSARAS